MAIGDPNCYPRKMPQYANASNLIAEILLEGILERLCGRTGKARIIQIRPEISSSYPRTERYRLETHFQRPAYIEMVRTTGMPPFRWSELFIQGDHLLARPGSRFVSFFRRVTSNDISTRPANQTKEIGGHKIRENPIVASFYHCLTAS